MESTSNILEFLILLRERKASLFSISYEYFQEEKIEIHRDKLNLRVDTIPRIETYHYRIAAQCSDDPLLEISKLEELKNNRGIVFNELIITYSGFHISMVADPKDRCDFNLFNYPLILKTLSIDRIDREQMIISDNKLKITNKPKELIIGTKVLRNRCEDSFLLADHILSNLQKKL